MPFPFLYVIALLQFLVVADERASFQDVNVPVSTNLLKKKRDAVTTTTSPVTSTSDATDAATSTPAPVASSIAEKGSGSGEIKGYYSLSWNNGNSGPKDSNQSVFFSGWNDIKSALDEYDPKNQPKLVGFKYFSFGGGDKKSGSLNRSKLSKYIKDLQNHMIPSEFDGVMFDIEVITESADVMIPAFAKAFK